MCSGLSAACSLFSYHLLVFLSWSDHCYWAASLVNRRQCWRFNLLLGLLDFPEALFTWLCEWGNWRRWKEQKEAGRVPSLACATRRGWARLEEEFPHPSCSHCFPVGCLQTSACHSPKYCLTQKLTCLFVCFPVSLNIFINCLAKK